ncbi:DUF2400 family protein, partial [bacterium]|nr:DUF2400 family protein [bacterium]
MDIRDYPDSPLDSTRLRRLKPFLDRLYGELDLCHISPDPIEVVHEYALPEDREVAGFVASALAYGNVRQILRSVRNILAPLGARPSVAIREMGPGRTLETYRGFRHRFNSGADAAFLILSIGEALRRYGSLHALFLKGYRDVAPHIGPALEEFAGVLGSFSFPLVGEELGRLGIPSRARFFFSRPSAGSACKRLNLFLRWMV